MTGLLDEKTRTRAEELAARGRWYDALDLVQDQVEGAIDLGLISREQMRADLELALLVARLDLGAAEYEAWQQAVQWLARLEEQGQGNPECILVIDGTVGENLGQLSVGKDPKARKNDGKEIPGERTVSAAFHHVIDFSTLVKRGGVLPKRAPCGKIELELGRQHGVRRPGSHRSKTSTEIL